MPVAILETPPSPLPPQPPRKRWTRSECEAMEAAGVLDYPNLELIEGELINRMGKNRPHSIALFQMRVWLSEVFGPLYVQHETPIDVATEDNAVNEPEPDLIITSRPFSEYRTNPQPSEVRLAVEVADATLAFDRSVKARLYARAGIVEFWIVDVNNRRILVHRDPERGQYRTVIAFEEHESVSPLAAPNSPLTVRDAFPA